METNELITAVEGIKTATDGFGKKLAELAEIKSRIERMETAINRPGGGVPGRVHDPRSDAKAQMLHFMRTGNGLEAVDTKQLQGNIGASGGFAVPEQIDAMIVDQIANISPVRRVSQVVLTSSPDYVKLIGVRGTGTGWTNETGTRSETATPQMAAVRPSMGEIYTYGTVTRHLLEDAAFNIEAWLIENIVTEFAVEEGAAFVTGNGVNKPTGFLAGDAPVADGDATRDFGVLQYIPTGASGAFASSNPDNVLYDAIAALKPGYRAGAVWMMNSTTAAAVRKMKDADGRSLWADSLAEGQPARLLGYPVEIAEDMPDIGANSLAIAFGNFTRGYLITDRAGMTMIRDEVTRPGFVKLYAAKRVGGSVSDSNAIKLIKFAGS
ncbi:MAG: phage major capsid protein [Sagittula sp.]|uniref:phage major capsid protein n=1 Tax=Sagittula sp. TaxID=2038081 RepID=UPI004059C5C1